MAVIKPDTLLVIALRSSNDHANNASGNHALAPAETDKPKLKRVMNKYMQYVMIVPLNREHRIGSQTSQTSRTM